MGTSILTVLAGLWGKKNWILAGLAVALLAALAWGYAQGLRLDAVRADAARQITAEQAAHNATRAELTTARQEIDALSLALAYAHNSTAAVQGSLRDALAREAEAMSAAVARKQILDQVRTRTRTEAEKLEVVDDDTRHRVADRINRPL